jgi:CRP-like cAMP-binding protein
MKQMTGSKEILKGHIAKTVALTDDQFNYVFSHFKYRSFKKGQNIITAGDQVDAEYFVLSGCLKSFYSHAKATINLDCITDTEVLCLSNEDREKICGELHLMEHFFRWRTNKGYVASQKRLLSLMNNNVKHRYEELLKQYPALYNIVPKNLIAAYLGVSRETLSRLYQHEK